MTTAGQNSVFTFSGIRRVSADGIQVVPDPGVRPRLANIDADFVHAEVAEAGRTGGELDQPPSANLGSAATRSTTGGCNGEQTRL